MQKYELKIQTEFKLARYVFRITSLQTGEVSAQGNNLQCKQCGNPCTTALKPCGEILCTLCLADNKSCPICGQAIELIIRFKIWNIFGILKNSLNLWV